MVGVNDLIAWLRTQLDTDERRALAANVKQDDPDWWVSPVIATAGEHFTVRSRRDNRPIARVQRLDGDEDDPAGILDGEAVAEHIASHDPARVIRQVQAHRALLDDYDRAIARRREHPDDVASAADLLSMVRTVKRLSSIYSDRDGYNPEWVTG